MKKIFKKSLAIMVSAAICLTALIGCLSVSAATRGEGTFTVGSDSGKPGELVTVPIELAYTSSNGEDGMGIAASLFDVSFDTDALTITDIAAGEDATYTPDLGDVPGGGDVPPQDIYTVEYRSTDGETISVVDGAVRILAMPADNETVLTSMTVNLTFTINEGAAAQDYAITITEQQTCDYGQATPDGFGSFTYADNEEFIDMTITNGKITVVEDAQVEDAITYTTAKYDIAKSELVVGREAPSQLLKDKLSEATSAGNRKVQLVVDIDGTEFLFDVKITTGAGSFTASGFALTHLSSNISLYVRITADGDFLFETNAYNVVLADVVAEMAEGGDAKATALNELYSVWSTTDEILPVTNATIEEGAVDYTTVSYDVKKSEITIGRDVPSEELKQILSEASSNGNRLVKLVVDIGGAEYLFDVKITTGAGTFTTSGFALPHFTQDIKVSVRVISGASGEYVVNTNAVTVNLDSLMDTSVDSTFANAYNTFVNIQ